MSLAWLRLDLRLRYRLALGIAVGAGVYLLIVIAAYPSFRTDTSFDDLIHSNPAAAATFGINGSITSPAGWLSANMYANFAPLLALLLTIGYGAGAIAGENSGGLLGLTLVEPVSRTRVLVQKELALMLLALVVPVASLLACLAGPHFELHPDWWALLGVSLNVSLLAFDLGTVALLVGALTDNRGLALGIASGVAAAAYLLSSLSPVIHAASSARWLSPFYWAVGADQLARGDSVRGVVLLLATAIVLAAACVPALRRMDVS